MKKMFSKLIALSVLLGLTAAADDIDVLVIATEPEGQAYIHIVLDISTDATMTQCNYGPGGSCAPPYMSKISYENLREGHSDKESISKFEVFSAVITTVLKNPNFDTVSVALLTPDNHNGGDMLTDYHRLGTQYAESSGREILTDTLRAVVIPSVLTWQSTVHSRSLFYDWYRNFIDRDTVSVSAQCSMRFPVFLESAGAGENDLFDPLLHRQLGIDVSRGASGIFRTMDPIALEYQLTLAFERAVTIARIGVSQRNRMTGLATTPQTRDIYIAGYKPSATIKWGGNLKKYKRSTIAESNPLEVASIVDRKGKPAIVVDGDDKGAIVFDALSFWTEVASLPPGDGFEIPINADGPIVMRGGAGQRVPGFVADIIGDINESGRTRQLYVEPPVIINDRANTLWPFNADGIGIDSTASNLLPDLNVSTVLEAQQLIRWGRGQDVDDEDGDGNVVEARRWIMGSVIHSTPLAINYGSVAGHGPGNPKVTIFFGGGDGIFHAVDNTTSSGKGSGREIFGFYPRETLGDIILRRRNVISSLKMRYGVDGAAVSFVVDNNNDGNLRSASPDNDEAYVYFGMRRGGNSYYALNVSNPEKTPTLQWKISRTSHGNNFKELGLTFSRPVVGKVKFAEQSLDVLIFSGGYHGGWNENYSARIGKDLNGSDDEIAGDSFGNAIFIVNARTGELIWKTAYGAITNSATTASNTVFHHSEMVDSIPSSVSVLKNANGIIERLYVGDTGGALWRIDLPAAKGADTADHRKEHWFTSKLAELGRDGLRTDRRFFHAPDVVKTTENDGRPFDGVLISSGNRAAPNDTDVINYLFYIKDHLIVSGADEVRQRTTINIDADVAQSGLTDRTACLNVGINGDAPSCGVPTGNGWMIKLTQPGEKGLSSPLVEGGRVFFTTYVPGEKAVCSPSLGESYLYLVNLLDATGVTPGEAITPIGSGVSPGAISLGGKHLLIPLADTGELEGLNCRDMMCTRTGRSRYKTYWRQPDIDEI